jgi:hypothetical protein
MLEWAFCVLSQRALAAPLSKRVCETAPLNVNCTLNTPPPRHLPGAPFGRARKEFADCIAGIVKGEKLRTVLLADLNFPEKAF